MYPVESFTLDSKLLHNQQLVVTNMRCEPTQIAEKNPFEKSPATKKGRKQIRQNNILQRKFLLQNHRQQKSATLRWMDISLDCIALILYRATSFGSIPSSTILTGYIGCNRMYCQCTRWIYQLQYNV